jgi:hypothetical protein
MAARFAIDYGKMMVLRSVGGLQILNCGQGPQSRANAGPAPAEFFTMEINANYCTAIIYNFPRRTKSSCRVDSRQFRDEDGRPMIAAPATGFTSLVVGLTIEATFRHICSFT